MKFKIKYKTKSTGKIGEELYDSTNLYYFVGNCRPRRIEFKQKEDSVEEFTRFAEELLDNYNFHNPEKLHREFVEVIIE